MMSWRPTHDKRTPIRIGHAGLPAVLFCLALAPGHITTVKGAELASGNALNPAGIDVTDRVDPLGMSESKDFAKTPTGFLYPPPTLPSADRGMGNGWRYDGSIEVGSLFLDSAENAAEFHDYRDFSEGGLINYFNFSWLNPDSNYRIDLSGGGPGRDDQYYRFNASRPGRFRLSGFYSELPHEYARNALTLFQGAGTTQLSLPGTLQPGNNTLAEIRDALASAGNPRLSLQRQQSGLGLEYRPGSGISLRAGFRHQQREGARPFGGTLFPPFYTGDTAGGMYETIEPLDSSTNEFTLGMSLVNTRVQWNLDYKSSFYTNHAGELVVDTPFQNLPNTGFLVEQARYDLTPDNDYHELSSDFALRLARNAQVFATASWSTMRQDDALLPPTVNSGLTYSGIDLGQWNTPAALPAGDADAQIDTLLLQAGLRLQPLNSLNVNATIRHRGQDNDTNWTALNPLTGQYGYITADGAAGDSVFAPGRTQEPIHYRNIPFAEDVTSWNLEANYRLRMRSTLSVEANREERRPAYRERRRVNENTLRTSLSTRALSWATFRMSFERSERGGDNYDADPWEAIYTTSLPDFTAAFPDGPMPRALAELRRFDLGDYEQDKWTFKGTFLLGEAMNLLFTADYRDTDYDARYGLLGEDKASYSLEWNYQPSARFNAYAFVSRQFFSSSMATINDFGASTDASAGGATYPFDAAWLQETDGRNHFAGLGLRLSLGRMELDSSWSLNHSTDGTLLQAASNAALASPQFGGLYSELPQLAFSRHILENSLRWFASDRMALRFYHRYETSSTEDWHYAGLEPLINRNLFLNAQPQDYKAHLFGIFAQYRIE